MSKPSLQGVDLSRGVGLSIPAYIDLWYGAVVRQGRRLLWKRATLAQRHTDAMLLVIALHQLLVAVEFAKAKMKSKALRGPIREFEKTFGGNLAAARDAITHFDEWRAGIGKKQQPERDGSWVFTHAIAVDLRPNRRDARVVVRLSAKRAFEMSSSDALQAAQTLRLAAKAEIQDHLHAAASSS